MTDYDYTSWQFLDAIGQASPLQSHLQTQTDEAMSLAFEFPSTSTSSGNGQLMSSDNCLPCGQTSATAKQGYMQHSPPIEMGMNMGMDFEMEMFAQGMEFSVPTFPDFNLNLTLGHSPSHGKKAPDTHTHTHDLSLLRSTSLNAAAAERALFMTPSVTSPSSSSSSSNQHSSPIDLDPCTPSTTSTTSKESDQDHDCDWDHPTATNLHYYKLPDRLIDSFQAVPRLPRVHNHHHHQHPYRVNNNNHRDGARDEEEAEELTPLEMPDGTTRFTANWLPVDPTAGFTIGSEFEEGRSVSVSGPASKSAVEYGYEYGRGYGHGYGEQDAYGYGYGNVSMELEFCKEAFIQMPAPAPV